MVCSLGFAFYFEGELVTNPMQTAPYSDLVLNAAAAIEQERSSLAGSGATGATAAKRKPKRKSKTGDLQAYTNKLMAIPAEVFVNELHGVWLSDYGVRKSVPFNGDLSVCPKPSLKILLEVALTKGAKPLGFVAENKRNRGGEMRFTTDVRPDKRIYVGENMPKFSAFATRWSYTKS